MKFKLAILFISLPLLIFGNSISTFSETLISNHSAMACCSSETESAHDCCCDHSESSSDCESQCAASGCFFSSPTFISNTTLFAETVTDFLFDDTAVTLEPASLIPSYTGSIWIPPKIFG